MKAPFPYYGGKTRIAPWIAGHLPEHRVYVEPFCGSGAVLFAKPESAFEIINDVDGNVVNFFKTLRDEPDELKRICTATPYSREEYATCNMHEDGITEVERARRFFVLATQSFNGAGPAASRSSWAPSIRQGGSKAHAIRRMVDRLDDVADRLRNVTVECRSYEWVIDRYDSPDAAIYVDPPYLGSTRGSLVLSGGKRIRDYAHDMTTEEEHRELAALLHGCEGAVVLSGYPSGLYEELYGAWWRSEIPVHRSTANRRGVPAQRAIEVVWSNRPINGQQESLPFEQEVEAT